MCRANSSRDCGLVELAQHVVDVHDIAFVLSALGQHPRFECRYLYGDLVGLELDQRITGGNSVSLFPCPPRYGGLNDRFSEGRDLYGEHSD